MEELKIVLMSSLEEFLKIYSVVELSEILINEVSYKELCNLINKMED